jgi:hypothetical protein
MGVKAAAIIFFACLAMEAHAVEPSRVRVEDSIAGGRLAFIGTVEAARVVEWKPPARIVVSARVRVTWCLVGAACRRPEATILYFHATDEDAAVEADFSVGDQYLFVFNMDRTSGAGPLQFEPKGSSGRSMDVAFAIGSYVEDFRITSREIFASIWGGGPKEWIEGRDLDRWAAARRERKQNSR